MLNYENEIKMTESSSRKNQRIAKNTLLLYIRMFATILVSLYTSRVILNTLGVQDFGIYNIVGSIVVLFSFVNGALVTSTQRFLNFEIGKQDIAAQRDVFSTSMLIYFLFCIVVVIIAEIVGISLINSKLNIPIERLSAAKAVFHFSLLAFCINIIRVPFNAVVIAHEKMSFYAYLSILEVVLKLGVIYLLFLIEADKLIVYSALIMSVSVIILFTYWFYCKRNFPVYKVSFSLKKDTYMKLLGFSGWSLFGSIANLSIVQGINFVFNIFYGVTVNASLGITNQVKNAVNSFLSSFQVAFNPQIIKSFAAGEKDRFYSLIANSSKYSYYLMYIITIPFIFNAEFIIEKWLNSEPLYVVRFCQLTLVNLLIDSVSAPLGVAMQASGNIKKYQIYYSLLSLSVLPVVYFLTSSGKSPEFVYLAWTITNIVLYLWKINFVSSQLELSKAKYLKDVILPVLLVTLVSLPLILLLNKYIIIPDWLGFILSVSSSCILSIALIFFLGIAKNERDILIEFIKKKIVVLNRKQK